MPGGLLVHEDRLFPADPTVRTVARNLYDQVRDLPIVSPHGHTDPRWFAEDEAFPDPVSLFIKPDHYLFRMLYSQGIPLEALGIARRDGATVETDSRAIWGLFAENYHLFRGTPSRLWFDHALAHVFGIDTSFGPETADEIYDTVSESLGQPAYRPRALFDRFNIEVLATTESPLEDLRHHDRIRDSGWQGRIVTCFRPDPVVDPDYEGFAANIARLGEITGEDTDCWKGYLAALRSRRAYFIERGATSTDHGHPTAVTADQDPQVCESLFAKARAGTASAEEAELFRAQMLTEMAHMSLDDGLVMSIHPGCLRNHNRELFTAFGRDMGADIPMSTDYVNGLRPLLDRFGNERRLSVILFTLDEATYGRELATLAGHYPVIKLGPAWWFFDSPEGMLRYRRAVTEIAGFYNTVGFNDDTRAFLSIPGRHDVARRVDCRFLAELVCEHRLAETEAVEVAHDLAYRLAKRAYHL